TYLYFTCLYALSTHSHSLSLHDALPISRRRRCAERFSSWHGCAVSHGRSLSLPSRCASSSRSPRAGPRTSSRGSWASACPSPWEIGRASCRERVGVWVVWWGVREYKVSV